ncbi:MAG: peptidylprolyl isomerase [Bryobacteraceae bacterium]
MPLWAASAALLALTATLGWSQTAPAAPGAATPPPPQAQPQNGMTGLKARGPLAVTQTDPNRVVAVINGQKLTAKQAMEVLQTLTAEERKHFPETDAGTQQALQNAFIRMSFAEEADKLKMADASPWKEDLEGARRSILFQAYLQRLTTGDFEVKDADVTKYYADHPAEFEQMKLAVIQVSFLPPNAKPPADGKPGRTQAEAKAKAEDVVKKLRAGANFAEVAKTDSDDTASAGKGGEIGSFPTGKNNLPQNINDAVSKLKKGEVTDPLEARTGYYIILMSDRPKIPFDEAKPKIIEEIRSAHAAEVMKATMAKYKIQVEDNDFFDAGGKPAQPGQKAPPPQAPGQTQSH